MGRPFSQKTVLLVMVWMVEAVARQAAVFPVAPTDLTTLSAKNGGTFPQARALSYIYGDPENSHLARVMPEFGGEMAEDLVPVEIEGVLNAHPARVSRVIVFLRKHPTVD